MIGSCAATGPMQSLRMAEYLYQQGDTQQLDSIISVLLENTDRSRDAALTLGRLGDCRATPYLSEVIRTGGVATNEALIAIGMLQDTRAVTDLIQLIKQDSPLAPEAIRILGQLKDRRATPILMLVIEENRPYSLLATNALGEIGGIQAKDLLISRFGKPPVTQQENIQFRILQQDGQKQHNLTFELPVNLPPIIDFIDRTIEPEGYAIFRYLLKDTEYDSLDIVAEYSLDNGRNWHRSSTEGNLNSIVESGYQGSLVWRMDQDIDLNTLNVDPANGLLFKLTPSDRYISSRKGVPSVWTFAVDSTTIDLEDVVGEESGDVLFQYYYPNTTRAFIDSFAYHYSVDGGLIWSQASIRLGTTGATASQDSMYIVWSSDIDLPNLDLDVVQFRVSENTANTYGRYDVTLPFHLDNNAVPQVEFQNFNEDRDGVFYIGYQITDVENDSVNLEAQYSTDEGISWRKATVSGNLSNLTSERYTDDIMWFAEFDITEFRDSPLRLRLIPEDRDPGLFTDSRYFYLKNADFTKLTQGTDKGVLELSYSLAPDDSSKIVAQYSLDRGRTWQNATLRDISEISETDKKNVSLNWDIGTDIASYLNQIDAIGSALERIQDPSVVPDLLILARQRNSAIREMRHQSVEASRILDRKSPWIIEGLTNSLIYPDFSVQADALAILKTVDTPDVTIAIADYQYYLDEIARTARENSSMLNEINEQLYQDRLREPRTVTQEQSIDNMRKWWGFPRERAESFMRDLDVLRLQTALKEDFQAGRISEKDYLERLETLLLEARERRSRERNIGNSGSNDPNRSGGN